MVAQASRMETEAVAAAAKAAATTAAAAATTPGAIAGSGSEGAAADAVAKAKTAAEASKLSHQQAAMALMAAHKAFGGTQESSASFLSTVKDDETKRKVSTVLQVR